jgi:DNA-directed RNA polymerase subunit RPC12/RpoP
VTESPTHFLYKCINCERNFETNKFGRQNCPVCKTEIIIDPPEGYVSEEAPPPEDIADQEEQKPVLPVELENFVTAELKKAISDTPPKTESKPKHGRFRQIAVSIKAVLSNPTAFFQEYPHVQHSRPLFFVWVIGTLALFLSAIYQLWYLENNPEVFLQNLKQLNGLAEGQSPEATLEAFHDQLTLSLYLSPLLGLISPIVSAAFFHLFIRLLSKQCKGYKETFYATAYGSAPMIMAVIPFVGFLLGALWTVTIQVIGLANIHRISPLIAATSVIFPVLIMLLLFSTV